MGIDGVFLEDTFNGLPSGIFSEAPAKPDAFEDMDTSSRGGVILFNGGALPCVFPP